jgi:excisionase family DNA binding protein
MSRLATRGVFAVPTTSPEPPAAIPEHRLLVSPREAARVLAISERTLWQLTHDGAVRCVRIGRAVRYDPRDLAEYISRLRGKP